jgi:regulator of cell morphogenesis and NO signaling
MTEQAHPTLGEIVAANPAAARLLDRLGLDYCCHGQHTLDEACAAAGLDPGVIAASLAELPVEGDRSWTALEVPALVDHIVVTHHRYLDEELPLLDALAAKVLSVHGDRHPELSDIRALVDALRIELESHLREEEEVLFPLLRSWSGTTAGSGPALPEVVATMVGDHDQAGELLSALRRATAAYAVPDDACASYRSLFERLEALELDTHLHVHKENHGLFPAVLRMASV